MKHLIIPDTQVKEGVNTDHLEAVGNYAAHIKPDVIIHLGDHWDMPSLFAFDNPRTKGTIDFYEANYGSDLEAGREAFARLHTPIQREIYNSTRRKGDDWNPRLVFLFGNHEHRAAKVLRNDPRLKGAIGVNDYELPRGWESHPFLEIVEIDGILYCHYFVNQQSLMKNPLSGSIDNRLNKIKQSFTQGHQQTKMYGSQFLATGREIHGLVVGAFYSHDEEYLGPQGNHYWRGVVVKHEVREGQYDPMFVSLDYLIRKWT